MAERETEVEGYLRKRVVASGGLCVKVLPDYVRGIPDRLVLLPGGVVCWAELKRPKGGRLSAAQLVMHALLKRLGQRVEVVWSKADADRLLEDLVREASM